MNIIDELVPHITKTLEKEFSPFTILKRMIGTARDSLALLENLPRDIREIITKVKKGEIKVAVEHEGLDELNRKIDVASNRIAGGFIIGSILMASAILIAVKFPPLYKDISAPGGLGFIIANILGIRMLFTIFRGRKY